MKVDSTHITYCTNVHPGEGLADLHRILVDDVSRVKASVSPQQSFGAGLRLGAGMANALSADETALKKLQDQCRALDLYVFTVNGFPYGDFGSGIIKEAVYRPDWTTTDRVQYTKRLASLLVTLPGPPERTISTVAGGYGPDTGDAAIQQTIADNLGDVASYLAQLADETGVRVRLCLEPEPWTMLETTPGAIEFFQRWIHPIGAHAMEHLGLCYDCCHQAVYFEDPVQSLIDLEENGVPIGKVQVSSALHLDRPQDPEARAALLRFAEPRYLHQTVALTSKGVLRARDLSDLTHPDEAWLAAEAWRCHFHVPIWWTGDARG